MKRAVMRAVLTLLMLALPVAAQGQMTTQTVVEDGRTRATLAAFAEEAPQAVRSLMDGYGLGDARCVCGAALEKEPMAGDASADGLLFTSSALVVVERGGAYALAGLRWEPGGSNARVEDFGALGLPLAGDEARPVDGARRHAQNPVGPDAPVHHLIQHAGGIDAAHAAALQHKARPLHGHRFLSTWDASIIPRAGKGKKPAPRQATALHPPGEDTRRFPAGPACRPARPQAQTPAASRPPSRPARAGAAPLPACTARRRPWPS